MSRGTQDPATELCVFAYGAITRYGRPFQAVRLTRGFPRRGPSTPRFPCESRGLGCSDFARHYSRNHGCFLFLRVLRWFTSPGSLRHPMDSDGDDPCSHGSGSPIRTSPDHSLFATPRGLSQLTTSFLACLRQGIHTRALSSLTIKFTPDTECTGPRPALSRGRDPGALCDLLPVNIQLSKIAIASQRSAQPAGIGRAGCAHRSKTLVGLGGVEPPTSPLSGVRSSHLSYRPAGWVIEAGLSCGLGQAATPTV